jgi:hypothetical protein
VRGVFALLLAFGLVAAIAWLGFGRDAEQQVVEFGEGVAAVALLFLVPLILVGLIAVPFHWWFRKKLVSAVQDRDRRNKPTAHDATGPTTGERR